jgi:hypothetical protein
MGDRALSEFPIAVLAEKPSGRGTEGPYEDFGQQCEHEIAFLLKTRPKPVLDHRQATACYRCRR